MNVNGENNEKIDEHHLESSLAGVPTLPVSPLDHAKDLSQTNPNAQIGDLVTQTANLIAIKKQLLEDIAFNQHIQSMQVRAIQSFPQNNQVAPPFQQFDPRRRGLARMQKPESYKTVICQAWLESKTCSFADNCRFAHGEEELRPTYVEPLQNNKYKTKLCDKYTTTGLCPYGKRCLFIHPDHGPNAYIRADKLLEVSQRHALADIRDQMEQHIMTNGRIAAPPLSAIQHPLEMFARPSTPDEPAAKLPLGPTPVSTRGPRYELPTKELHDAEGAMTYPPSRWPLDPSMFALDAWNMAHRPASPLDSMVLGSAPNAGSFGMLGKQNTPGGVSGYSSAGSTPSQDLSSSSLNAASAAAAAAYFANSAVAQSLLMKSVATDPMMSCNGPFSPMPGFDQLAENMTKHLNLW